MGDMIMGENKGCSFLGYVVGGILLVVFLFLGIAVVFGVWEEGCSRNFEGECIDPIMHVSLRLTINNFGE